MSALSEIEDLVFGFITEAEIRAVNVVKAAEVVANGVVVGVLDAFHVLVTGLIMTSSRLAQQFVKSTFTVIQTAAETVLGTPTKS